MIKGRVIELKKEFTWLGALRVRDNSLPIKPLYDEVVKFNLVKDKLAKLTDENFINCIVSHLNWMRGQAEKRDWLCDLEGGVIVEETDDLLKFTLPCWSGKNKVKINNEFIIADNLDGNEKETR